MVNTAKTNLDSSISAYVDRVPVPLDNNTVPVVIDKQFTARQDNNMLVIQNNFVVLIGYNWQLISKSQVPVESKCKPVM